MKRTKRKREENLSERAIVIGMITSTDYLEEVIKICSPGKFLESSTARTLTNWILEYHTKYGKAPGNNIQEIYIDKLKNGLDKDLGADIEDILDGLSKEYVNDEIDPFLLDRTFNHFQERQREIHIQNLQEAGPDEFYNLQTTFQPIQKPLVGAEGLSGADLFTQELKPVQWLIEDLLPHGLTIFGGDSKTGKSFLTLNMILKLTQDRWMFADTSDTGFHGEPGSVLYLALEDSERRVMERVNKIELNPKLELIEKWFHVKYNWPMLAKGGLKDLEKWIEESKNPKLIVIDVMAKVWNMSSKTGGGRQYGEEYAVFGPLADVAHKYGISIIAITHATKGKQADPFMTILGGAGTQGAADNLMVLQRHPGDPTKRVLSIRGKDTDEQHLEFTVGGEGSDWFCEGERREIQKTAQREDIVELLSEFSDGLTVEAIREKAREGYIDVAESSIPVLLKKMTIDGSLEKLKYGTYALQGTSGRSIDRKIASKLRK